MEPTHRLLKDFDPTFRDLKILRDYPTPLVKYVYHSLVESQKSDDGTTVSSQYMALLPIRSQPGLRKMKVGIGWRSSSSACFLRLEYGRSDMIPVGAVIFQSTQTSMKSQASC